MKTAPAVKGQEAETQITRSKTPAVPSLGVICLRRAMHRNHKEFQLAKAAAMASPRNCKPIQTSRRRTTVF